MNAVTPAVVAYGLPAAAGDATILAAFADRCRDFAANYHRDLTEGEEDAYFARLDASERIINDTPATTISGVVAKLRIAFLRQSNADWADHAIMGPNCPAFVEGLAGADLTVRQAWAVIENLAAIGGVDLAAQAAGVSAEPSPFETKRLEYLALDTEVKASDDADGDPRFISAQTEMHRIESVMVEAPSQSRADAEAKLRFLLDTKRIGVPLDGEETHAIVEDAARFLLNGEASGPREISPGLIALLSEHRRADEAIDRWHAEVWNGPVEAHAIAWNRLTEVDRAGAPGRELDERYGIAGLKAEEAERWKLINAATDAIRVFPVASAADLIAKLEHLFPSQEPEEDPNGILAVALHDLCRLAGEGR